MTKFSPALTRAILFSLVLGLAGCARFLNSATRDGDFPSGAAMPPPDQAYARSVGYLQSGDYDRAAKDFQTVEQYYPYSTWSTHAELLAGYAQYKNQNYDDAISSLNHFIQLHPENEEVAYAYYLKALCYYEQIDDVQRDQTATYEAISALDNVVTRFPDSAYARDSRIKLRLAYNRLAGHEMVIGRYYEKQHLYAAAVGRFQTVVTQYQQTGYTPEALERLVEVYLDLGLPDEAVRAASVLGYNYPGTSWYETAYDKLKANGLVNRTDETASAAGAQTMPPPPKPHHHWYWPF